MTDERGAALALNLGVDDQRGEIRVLGQPLLRVGEARRPDDLHVIGEAAHGSGRELRVVTIVCRVENLHAPACSFVSYSDSSIGQNSTWLQMAGS